MISNCIIHTRVQTLICEMEISIVRLQSLPPRYSLNTTQERWFSTDYTMQSLENMNRLSFSSSHPQNYSVMTGEGNHHDPFWKSSEKSPPTCMTTSLNSSAPVLQFLVWVEICFSLLLSLFPQFFIIFNFISHKLRRLMKNV